MEDQVVFTRPIYSGKAFEKKIMTDAFTFVTIRPNNISPLAKDEGRTGHVEDLNVEIKNLRTVVKKLYGKQRKGLIYPKQKS